MHRHTRYPQFTHIEEYSALHYKAGAEMDGGVVGADLFGDITWN